MFIYRIWVKTHFHKVVWVASSLWRGKTYIENSYISYWRGKKKLLKNIWRRKCVLSTLEYVARLRAQAILCQFKIEYTDLQDQKQQLSYVDDMVTQQLIFGLRNHHHQSQVLSEAAVLTTLKANGVKIL